MKPKREWVGWFMHEPPVGTEPWKTLGCQQNSQTLWWSELSLSSGSAVFWSGRNDSRANLPQSQSPERLWGAMKCPRKQNNEVLIPSAAPNESFMWTIWSHMFRGPRSPKKFVISKTWDYIFFEQNIALNFRNKGKCNAFCFRKIKIDVILGRK